MEARKQLMWLFIFAILLCVVAWIYINRTENSTQPAAWHRTVSDNGPRFPGQHKPDFTSILDEDGKPLAGWQERTHPKHYTGYEQPVSQSVAYDTVNAPRRQALQVEQSARVGTNSDGYKGALASYNGGRSSSSSSNSVPRRYAMKTGGVSGSIISPNVAKAGEWSEYMPKQTLAEQRELNQKLKNLSAGVDRAIAKALLSKSKREQNIEKYLPKEQKQARAAQEAKSVEQEIASQANSIIDSIGKAYGQEAAQEAGKIMENFQREMLDTLSKPGDALEKQIAASKVSNKYNKQLEKLTDKEAEKKLREQLTAQNDKYLQQVREMYGDEVAGTMLPVLKESMEKQIKIYSTPQDEVRALQQLQEVSEQQLKAQREILQQAAQNKAGASPEVFSWQQQKEYWEKKLREGDKESYDTTDRAHEQMQKGFDKQAEQIAQQLNNIDPQAAQEARRVAQEFKDKLDVVHQKGGNEAEVNLQKLDDMRQANIEISQIFYNAQDKKNLENSPVEIPAEIKNAVLEICDDINRQIAELPYNDNIKDKQEAQRQLMEQKKERILALEQKMQQ